MTMQTEKGIVQSVTSKEFTSAYGRMMGHTINLITDKGETISVSKNTKVETPFTLAQGTKIQVTFQTVSGTGKTGKPYTMRKIVDKGLAILGAEEESSVASSATNAASSASSKTSFSGSYDPNGAKRGNAITNAVNILIHNKKGSIGTDSAQELEDLARMIYEVATNLESPAKASTAKAKTEIKKDILEDDDLFDME